MSILTWIEDKKRLKILDAPKQHSKTPDSSKGLWTRCDKCGVILYIKHLKENQRVCFGCSYHLQMMSGERIESLLDRTPYFGEAKARKACNKSSCKAKLGTGNTPFTVSTWRPLDETLSPCDPLAFHDQKAYGARLEDAQERTGLQDAIQTGTGMIDGIPVALAVMDFSFMGGSMGSVVGEKITRLIEYATGEGLTLIIVSASGGARMQEGVFSLMQMAKISSALQIYQMCARLLYISILTSPTTGGVTASFAMLGDIVLAEPKALIAFAGRRVIEQTLREDLPDDFQTSEYMLHHGLVDLIVPRRFLRQALSETIRLYQNAPFKRRGEIPFGVQNPITFLAEEKVRRQWGVLTKGAMESSCNASPTFAEQKDANANQRFARSFASTALQKPLAPGVLQSSALQAKGRKAVFLKSLQNEALRVTQSTPTTYREILTSFEIMLNLFVSGNGKKGKQTGYSSRRDRGFCKTEQKDANANQRFARRFAGTAFATSNSSLESLQKLFLHTFASQKLGKLGLQLQSSALRRALHKICNCMSKDKVLRGFATNNSSTSSYFRRLFLHTFASQKLSKKTVLQSKSIQSRALLATANQRLTSSLSRSLHENGSTPISEVETKSFDFDFCKAKVRKAPNKSSCNYKCKANRCHKNAYNSKGLCKPERRIVSESGTKDLFSRNDQRSRSCLLHSFRSFSEATQVPRSYNRLKASKEKLCLQTLLQSRALYTRGFLQHTKKSCKRLSKQAETSFKMLNTFQTIKTANNGASVEALPRNSSRRKAFTFAKQKYASHNLVFAYFCFAKVKQKSFVTRLFLRASDKSLSVAHGEKNDLFTGNRASKNKFTTLKDDISFLNQAIELAATESVEWRAFYIHQQLSENMGFLEDYLQQDPDSPRKTSNLLFYKSVCRSRKALDD